MASPKRTHAAPPVPPTAEAVAFLAIAYRELSQPADCVGDLSLIARAAAGVLMGDTDNAIFEALEPPEVLPALLPDLASLEPVRVEALLHAFPLLGIDRDG